MPLADALQPGSFRGVPFNVPDDTLDGGRRGPDWEFPLREGSYAEDLGASQRRWRLSVYVVGGGWLDRAAALQRELEKPGPGELIHPVDGAVIVQVRTWQRRRSLSTSGRVDFDITFVETDRGVAPRPIPDSRATVVASGDAAIAAIIADGANSLRSDVPDFALADLDGLAALSQGDWAGVAGRAAGAVIATAPVSWAAPVAALTTVAGVTLAAWAMLQSGAAGIAAAQAALARFLGYPTLGALGIGGYAPGLGAGVPAFRITTPDRLLQARNRSVFAASMSGINAVAAAMWAARSDYAYRDDAVAVQSLVTAALRGATRAMADVQMDGAYQSLRPLTAAVVSDLTQRAAGLATIQRVDMGASRPSLVVAHALWADATRAGDLEGRNPDALHPGILPWALEAPSR